MNNDQEFLKDLRNALINEIRGELTHNEIKEFEKEYIDKNFVARLLEKYLAKKRTFFLPGIFRATLLKNYDQCLLSRTPLSHYG